MCLTCSLVSLYPAMSLQEGQMLHTRLAAPGTRLRFRICSLGFGIEGDPVRALGVEL